MSVGVGIIHSSKPSRTSSPTPPFSSTLAIIPAINFLFAPPLGGCHTPSSCRPSLLLFSCSRLAAAVPPVAVFKLLGTPGCVSRLGGSIVLTASSLNCLPAPESTSIAPLAADAECEAIETASTTSATESSSFDGSKMILSFTAITSSVTDGLAEPAGYRCTDASQSSSNNGSSSCSDFNFGNLVDSNARCVVRDNNGSG